MNKEEKIEKLREVFTLLAGIERAAARIYRIFYDRFRDGEFGAFWYQISIEEDEHAFYFDNNVKLAELIPDSFGEPRCSIEELKQVMRELEELEHEAASYKTDLKRALQIALTIETTVKESDFVKLIDIRAGSLKRKFDYIVTETNVHKSELEAIVRRYKKP